MSVTLVYAVHGFLGQASDWQGVRGFLSPSITMQTVDLFSKAEEVSHFNMIRAFKGKKIYLGYSYGGRMGLQILNNSPDLFDHYIFLSTNPGFLKSAKDEREQRIRSDRQWAAKISNPNWSSFLTEWNTQPVFEFSKQEPVRLVGDFDLLKLKEALTEGSLGRQEDYRSLLSLHRNRITWAVGELDSKFLKMAEELMRDQYINGVTKVENSGHRIWLDNPEAVAEIISKLM